MRTWNHWLVLCLYDIGLDKHLTFHYQIDFLNYKHTLYMMLKTFYGPIYYFWDKALDEKLYSLFYMWCDYTPMP